MLFKSLAIPLIAAVSPGFFGSYLWVPEYPNAVNALASGFLVFAAVYFLMTTPGPLEETEALSKSVLAGLLVAEVLVLHKVTGMPPLSTITLWLFFYYNSVEKVSGGH